MLGCGSLSACSAPLVRAPCPGIVIEVSYIANSGPVLEPWTETWLISPALVTFERGGELGGNVNVGTWHVAVAPAAIERFLEDLGAVDCRPIEEIRPESPVDDSGSELYKIEYKGRGAFALWYVEGTTYSGAEVITGPIQAFMRQFPPPPEALARFLTEAGED